VHRDLACRDPWAESLERSHARRLRNGAARPFATAGELLPEVPRDLTDPDVLRRSAWRSQARRAAAAQSFEMPKPSPRGLSLAALFAVVGVPAVGVAGGLAGSTDTAEAATTSLEKGDRGPRVASLQRKLGIPADGVFGPATKRAVKRYQARHRLTVDGIAGPQTLRSLGGAARPAALRTASGPAGTRALQRALGIPADGVYGPQTKRAVKRYQARHGLTVDGVAGPQTLRSLRGGQGPTQFASYRKASRGSGVAALQRKLGIAADGVFGPGTEAAVKSFQRRHGLTADGVVGPATRSALGLGSGPVLKRGGRGGGGSATGGIVQRVIAAGNRIARAPYVYGGGHGSFTAGGYDCSGSVSYALHGGGLLKTPRDSSGLMSYGSPGRGKRITIYANPGHAYMVVDGRRFDTSAVRETGSRWTSTQRSSGGYVARHPAGL
jgi:peptidoglycan hydrolase-like protein with peptidoglycan-binding domain